MRQVRFVDFLAVLCVCNGKAVRPNQDRICQLLVCGAPELLAKFTLKNGVPMVAGDARYFSGMSGAGGVRLTEWIDAADQKDKDALAYVVGTIRLLSKLVCGNNTNPKTTHAVRRLMPFEVVVKIMTMCSPGSPDKKEADPVLEGRLPIATACTELMRHLYVDCKPHETLAVVTKVRVWQDVEKIAEEGKLSSRFVLADDPIIKSIDFEQFFAVKKFIVHFVSAYFKQVAVQIKQNKMVLQLLLLLLELIRLGFYYTDDLVSDPESGRMGIIAPLLRVLDGRDDRVGLQKDEQPEERYLRREDHRCSTVVLMECKIAVCQILGVIADMRLDVRLSKLLLQYKMEWEKKHRSTPAAHVHVQPGRGLSMSNLGRGATKVAQGLASRLPSLSYARLLDEDCAPPTERTTTTTSKQAVELAEERREQFDKVLETLRFTSETSGGDRGERVSVGARNLLKRRPSMGQGGRSPSGKFLFNYSHNTVQMAQDAWMSEGELVAVLMDLCFCMPIRGSNPDSQI